MKNHVFILIVILLIPNLGYAQNNSSIDSLKNLINNTTDDTLKVNALNELSYILSRSNPDSSLLISREAEALSVKVNFPKGIAYAKMYTGAAYTYLGDYYTALKWLLEALDLFEEQNIQYGIATCYNNLGRNYNALKDYDKALDYYLKSSTLYREIGDYDLSGKILNNVGYIYKLQSEYDKSLYYLFKSLDASNESNDMTVAIYPMYNIGSIYMNLNELDSAQYYLSRALEYSRKFNNQYITSLSLIDMGHMNKNVGRLNKAKSYYLEAYEITDAAGLKSEKSEASKALATVYEELNDTKSALQYHKIFKTTSDSLFNKETTRNMALLEADYNYESEKKEAEIERLQYEAGQKRVLEKTIWTRNSLFVGLIMMLMISYLLYKNTTRKRKANEMLKGLNEQIHEQKVELQIQSELLKQTNEEILTINENLENTIQKRTEKIKEQNDKLIKYLFYNSHKVRAPLARILGIVSLFNNNAINEEEIMKMLNIINGEANLLDKMVRKMTQTLESETAPSDPERD